jgi:hypothetical protein
VQEITEMMDIQEMTETLDMADVVQRTTIFCVSLPITAKMEVKK